MKKLSLIKKISLTLSMVFLLVFCSRIIPIYHIYEESGPTIKDDVYSITPSLQNIQNKSPLLFLD